MANGIRTGDPRGFNKGRSSKFREGSRVRQTPEEGRRTYRAKRCANNNKDEDYSPKTLNDKKTQDIVWKNWRDVERRMERVREIRARDLMVICGIRCLFIIIFTNPSARAGYDTRSIFKQSLIGLN